MRFKIWLKTSLQFYEQVPVKNQFKQRRKKP